MAVAQRERARGDAPAVPAPLRDRGILAAIAFALYTAHSTVRHLRWETGGYDLGLFEQAVRRYARLQPPYGELKGESFNLLGDHFHPILVTIAPLYRLFPSPVTLLVVQAALLALSVFVVTGTAQRVLGRRPGLLVGVAYALSWGIQGAIGYEFHEVAFAVPMLALCADRLIREQYRQAALWGCALVLVKEDLPVTIAALGVVLWLYGQRRLGVGVALFGAVSFVLVLFVLLPALSYWGHYTYWTYTGVTEQLSFGERLLDVVAPVKLWGLVLLLAPVAFTALRSPIVLLAAPTVLWHLASTNPAYSGTRYHYGLPLMPIVFLAAVDGLRRLRGKRLTPHVPVVMLVLGILTVLSGPFGNMLRPHWWQQPEYAVRAEAAVWMIPAGARVAAHNRLAAHLTSDRTVFLLDAGLRDTTGRTLDVDWIVAETTGGQFPITAAVRRDLLTDLQRCGFAQVHRDTDREWDFITLRRTDPTARGDTLARCLEPG